MFRLIYIVLFIGFGCSTTPETRSSARNATSERTQEISGFSEPVIKVVPASVKHTFDAAVRVLSIYSVKENKLDTTTNSALLRTEPIIGEEHNVKLYELPTPPAFHSQIRSSLILKLYEGQYRGRVSTRVEVTKLLQQRKDFYSGWETLGSDKIEETIILDQIWEEVLNDLALERAKAPRKEASTEVPQL